MTIQVNDIWVYRIIPIANLEIILNAGMHSKLSGVINEGFVSMGNTEIITERDKRIVKCYPNSVVNNYVPFYFSVRTPMLYNIITGYGVSSYPQQEIIYLCFKLTDLATDNFTWCYTDGNAAKKITKFNNDLNLLVDRIDWNSIKTHDFRDGNGDGDEDRLRKKHAEFLVKDFVPKEYIKRIVVFNETKKTEVSIILDKLGIDVELHVNPANRFYFI